LGKCRERGVGRIGACREGEEVGGVGVVGGCTLAIYNNSKA